MLLKYFKFNYLPVFVFVVSILIYTLNNNNMALGFTTIYCDSEFTTLANAIINLIENNEPLYNNLLINLSNLELLENIVGVSNNGYDIESNQSVLFFELFFQSQELSVELVNDVNLYVLKVNNVIYTVHPCYIHYILDLFTDVLY